MPASSGRPGGRSGGSVEAGRAEIAKALLDSVFGFMARRWHPGADPGRHAEFKLLRLLTSEPRTGNAGLRVVDLCELLAVRPPTVSRLVDSLAARGLVERASDPEDRRALRIRASEAGLALAGAMRARAVAETEGLVDHLGFEDARTLAALLARSAAYFAETRSTDRCKETHHKC